MWKWRFFCCFFALYFLLSVFFIIFAVALKTTCLRGLLSSCLCAAFSISLYAASIEHYACERSLDSLLLVLDKEVTRSSYYFEIREQAIESLRRLPMTQERQLAIANLYQPYQSDSSMLYLSRLIDADGPVALEARIRLLYLASSVGSYNTGIRYIVSSDSIPQAERMRYFDALSRLYGGASENCKEPKLQAYYAELAEQYKDSVRRHLPVEPDYASPFYNYYMRNACRARDMDLALAVSDSVGRRIEDDAHEYAIWAYRRADIYLRSGDTLAYRCWLVRSAIADVRSGTSDNGSSWLVAQFVFDEGQLERAYRYIEYSLANAALFNATSRYLQTHPVGHIIGNAYREQQHRHSQTLLYLVVALVIGLLLFILIAAYTLRQNHSLHRLNRKLETLNQQLNEANMQLNEANDVKQQYICQYLEVNSEYIHRMSKLARKAGDNDPQGFMDREMEEFYKRFDNTFLSLYPNFVDEFNQLLRPEDRITPKPGELLTTELRIFALIRLGIDSSAKIADLLCYSRNTIGNYRVRVKNAAAGERADFESRVRTIGRPLLD